MEALLGRLGEEVVDVEQETFEVFSQPRPSQGLGMIDPKATELNITIAGHDYEIKQSPGLLQSSRKGGTTGATVWEASVRFAEWLAWSKNPMFASGVLCSDSVALELGTGIAGIIPCILSSRMFKIVATDQQYVLKTARENISLNNVPSTSQRKSRTVRGKPSAVPRNVDVVALDWENDNVTSILRANSLRDGVDFLFACDCIFNYALIDPLVKTCVEICEMRTGKRKAAEQVHNPTICVTAQQLRQPDVYKQWLDAFCQRFRVWRLPDAVLTEQLHQGSGFVVYLGTLKDLSSTCSI